MPGRIGFHWGLIYIAVRPKNGGINLNSLYVNASARGRGYAEYALRHILVTADQLRLPLYLRAKPYGTCLDRPDVDKLRSWYSRFGFWRCTVPDGDRGWMWRPPRRHGVIRIPPRPARVA